MDQEGVIKYELWFLQTPPLPMDDALRALEVWRATLHRHRLLGQDPARYDGYGYGNVSHRVPPYEAPPHARAFVITASQTGGLARLTGAHYARVRACFPEQNLVLAEGPLPPSSESLTHAAVYALDPRLRAVLHVHSPEIWLHAAALGLPTTRPDVPYGTPAMAEEVERLFRETDVQRRRVFSMGGHEDGIIAFGPTVEEAGAVLMQTLAEARRLR